jgi:hypothetical protein
MRFHVDAWSPSYGSSADASDRGPDETSSAKLDADIEVSAKHWKPVDPPARERPERVLFVDGVRRTDARLWIGPHRGLACSYAAGVVECLPGTARVLDTRVQRVIFTSAPAEDVAEVGEGPARYQSLSLEGADEHDLTNRMQHSLIDLEIEVSRQSRTDGDLLLVDGPLRGRDALPRTLGYVKTQQKQYLPERLTGVVTGLRAGQRTPVFRIAGVYQRLTWYLRLPGGNAAPWSGMVRIECSAELPEHEAIALADLSAATVPRFASVSFKDPRAPQNLVPIAGLEKRLRMALGDARLLHRTLVRASQ